MFQTVEGKGVVWERLDVTVSQGGNGSFGRDVTLQTVQGERGRSGET